jgi:hypothetical protein
MEFSLLASIIEALVQDSSCACFPLSTSHHLKIDCFIHKSNVDSCFLHLKIVYTAETFVVDTSNTKMLLEKYGNNIREKGILVISMTSGDHLVR